MAVGCCWQPEERDRVHILFHGVRLGTRTSQQREPRSLKLISRGEGCKSKLSSRFKLRFCIVAPLPNTLHLEARPLHNSASNSKALQEQKPQVLSLELILQAYLPAQRGLAWLPDDHRLVGEAYESSEPGFDHRFLEEAFRQCLASMWPIAARFAKETGLAGLQKLASGVQRTHTITATEAQEIVHPIPLRQMPAERLLGTG